MLPTEGSCFCLFNMSFCDIRLALHKYHHHILLLDFCGGSLEECARYLETLKTYENKPADNIQERTDNDYLSRVW